MRSTIAVVALLGTAVLIADGQDKRVNDVPTDQKVVNMVGGRLAKLFSQFGVPEVVYPVRGEEGPDSDFVIMEYHGAFAFGLREKTVGVCYFMPGWKGKIKGINLGDSREQVFKTLGDDHEDSEVKNDEGVFDCKWELQEEEAWFWVIFDKNDKAKKVTVQVK